MWGIKISSINLLIFVGIIRLCGPTCCFVVLHCLLTLGYIVAAHLADLHPHVSVSNLFLMLEYSRINANKLHTSWKLNCFEDKQTRLRFSQDLMAKKEKKEENLSSTRWRWCFCLFCFVNRHMYSMTDRAPHLPCQRCTFTLDTVHQGLLQFHATPQSPATWKRPIFLKDGTQ